MKKSDSLVNTGVVSGILAASAQPNTATMKSCIQLAAK